MAGVTQGNIITFLTDSKKRIYLRMEGSMRYGHGIKPSVWQFSCFSPEFDAIGDDRFGLLQFHNDLDVSKPPGLSVRAEIVDVEASVLGVPLTRSPKDQEPIDLENSELIVIEYKLAIADSRAAFQSPRGGILTNGEINKKPIKEDKLRDANFRPLRSNVELASACLKAMGFVVVTKDPKQSEAIVPGSLDESPRLVNLDWKAARPADELEKIVKACGHIIFPTLSGGLIIAQPGVGQSPDWTGMPVVSNVPLKSIDRRANTLLVVSAPNAIRETKTFYGIDSQGLEYCYLDFEDGVWKRQSEINYLKNVNLVDQLHQTPHFKDVPSHTTAQGQTYDVAEWLRRNAFRCIRLNPDVFKQTQILPYVVGPALKPTPIELMAKIYSYDRSTGTFERGVVERPVQIMELRDNNKVLFTLDRLVNLPQGAGAQQSETDNMVPLGGNELFVRLSFEPLDMYGKEREMFRVGFRGTAENFEVIPPADVEGFKADVTIVRPELIQYRFDGQEANVDELIDEASNLCTAYLPHEAKARRVVLTGFNAIELSQHITSISISQTPPRMMVDLDDFASLKVGGFKGVENSQNADQERQSNAIGEYAPSTLPLATGGAAPSGGGDLFYVKLAMSDGSDGGLNTKPSYRYSVFTSANKLIESSVIPSWQRCFGSFVPAETGIARYKSDGKIQLLWGDEIENTGQCETE